MRRWGLELIVVFVGVYAAFLLSEYRAAQQTERQRAQIQQALLQEIEEVIPRSKRVSQNVSRILARYDSSIAAGARPTLAPFIEPVTFRPHMWESSLESGGLELLDVPILYRISEFYNALDRGFEQIDQLRDLSETILLPNMGRGPEEFYDPETGQLRPKYAWYLDGQRRLIRHADVITAMGEELVRDLTEERPDQASEAQP